MGLDRGIDIGKRADRTADRARGDLGAHCDQPLAAAHELRVRLRQLEPERHRLGMNAMAAADRRCVLVLLGAVLERGEQQVEIFDQDVARASELYAERGVEHVGTGHALVHETRFVTDLLGHPGQESDDVVLGHRLDCIDRFDIDCRLGLPPVPQRLRGALRDHAEFAQFISRVSLDFEPDAVARLGLPDRGHRGAGVAGDH